MLNTDVALHILLLLDSLEGLFNTIRSGQMFLDAFHQRRNLVIATVLCREIQLANLPTSKAALTHADAVVKRLGATSSNDAIILYEGLRPLMISSSSSNGAVRPHFPWSLKLARLYTRAGRSALDQKLMLLEEAYQAILTTKPYFDPAAETPSTPQPKFGSRLSKVQRDICRELNREYCERGRLSDKLEVQKNVLQRMALGDSESHEWRIAIMKTYRTLHDFEGAVCYARSLYNIARANDCLDASLSWARHVVAEYINAGQHAEALRQHEYFLTQLLPGTKEHIAWARRLIALQKRAGYTEAALLAEAAVWQQMTIDNACYFGWARQLADDYRTVYRNREALMVIEKMYREAKRQSATHKNDNGWKFHATQSARALAAEYEFCGRMEDARSIQTDAEMR